MVGVGGLAALINVVVLITVAVADRAIELTVRNFAASSLQNRKRAPVVHDSDTWLPNIPRSLFKYYRHPAILLTVLCTVLLIASELVTEIGVDISQTCKPEKRRGSVITEGDISRQVTVVEKGASAFLLQNLTFFDGPLTRVPAGIPRRIRGNECLSCMDKDMESYPDVVSHCSVKKGRSYEAGELEIGTDGSDLSPFGNVTVGFKELFGDKTEYLVSEKLLHGDITFNGANYAAFIFHMTSSKPTDEVIYFEYFAQEHLRGLIETMKNRDTRRVWEATQSRVYSWKIKCDINELSGESFQTALSVYRTIQLENPINPATYDVEAMRFAEMTEEDIYRASLSIKVIDDSHIDGEYFIYTTCGVYRWMFLIPMCVSLGLVLVLGLVSIVLSPGRSIVRSIPYNSRTWFRHARKTEDDYQEEEFDPELQTIRENYMGSMSHEIFLLEFGEEPGAAPRIGCRSKRRPFGAAKEYPESKTPPSGSMYNWY